MGSGGLGMKRKRNVCLVMAAMLVAMPVAAQAADGPPFRPAVAGGDLLFLSGQIGQVPQGADPDGAGFDDAARGAMDALGKVLAAHGRSYADVVKCTVMLADMGKWARFNTVYASYFAQDRWPARSAFGGVRLAFDAPLEVECIATAKRPRR